MLHELPSEGSEYAESGDTEEYVAELSDDSDISVNNDDEEVDDRSQAGSSTQPQVATWI